MKLIICIAGFNTRFHDVGFDIPKYLLPWGNSTIIEEILNKLTYNYSFNKIILLANQRDIYFKDLLVKSTEKYSPIIRYINDTLGQAHTAAIAVESITDDDYFMIHNGDTIVCNRDISKITESLTINDAHIDVFSADSPKYCYVKAIQNKVTDIVEKKTLSPYASSGLYCFKNAAIYLKNYRETVSNLTNSEIYVSDVLATMLKNKASITINDIEECHITTVIGSPQEYSTELNKKTNENN
jgi:NDP-sugar pyrophosphorylase family protein